MRTTFLTIALCLFTGVCLLQEPPQAVAQAKKTVRQSVTGTGSTEAQAMIEADRNANAVAGGGNYTVISRRTTGSGNNFVCTLVIEFKQ